MSGVPQENSWEKVLNKHKWKAGYSERGKSGLEGDLYKPTVVIQQGGTCLPYVMAATQIYNMLKSYKGKVTVKIDSLAASAASVIAMAGDEVLMSPLSLLFIHNPLTVAAGNADDMQKAIDMLDEVKESIINAYELKSGLSRAKISHMMDCESWLSAKKAVELGFADSIMFSKNDTDTDDSYEFSQREVSNRLMNQLIKKNTPTAGVKICDLQTRLNLLK